MNNKELKYVNKIVNNYTESMPNKIDELRQLDKKVKTMPRVISIIFGIVSSLIFGFGMCVAMQVILEGFMWIGLIIGILGAILMIINYPIFNKVMQSRKNNYSEQIQTLSKELLNE